MPQSCSMKNGKYIQYSRIFILSLVSKLCPNLLAPLCGTVLTKCAAACQCVFCNQERMVVCLVPQYPDRICLVALPETPMLSRTCRSGKISLAKGAYRNGNISVMKKFVSAQKIRHVFCGRYHILAWSFFERSEDNARLYGSLGRPG